MQFPSNFQLSAARAQAVRTIIARVIGDAGRVSAEGRADADALASNATQEGREHNRRIEIVLRRPGLNGHVAHRHRLLSRWILSLVGVVAFGGLAWFFGPLLPQLEDVTTRLALIIVKLLTWAGANIMLDRRRGRRDQALTDGVTVSASVADEEAEALRTRLATALQLLKKSSRNRGYLYEQPWYAIIGPPGAGKTTALLNSGLRFPLARARWGRARSRASAGRGSATGGSPRMPC